MKYFMIHPKGKVLNNALKVAMVMLAFSFCLLFIGCSKEKNVPEAVNRVTASDSLTNAKKLEEQKRYYIAWEEYRQILEKEPGNVEAQEGLERLKQIFPYGSPDPIKDADIFTSQKMTVSTYTLDTGGRVSGIPIEETAETIRVEGKYVEVTLKKSEIKETIREEVDSSQVLSPEARYKTKATTISEDDTDGHFLLSVFCMVNGLMEQANLELQKATTKEQRYSLLFRSTRLQYFFDIGMAKLHAGSASNAKQYFEACAQEGRGTQMETEALKKISECDEQIARQASVERERQAVEEKARIEKERQETPLEQIKQRTREREQGIRRRMSQTLGIPESQLKEDGTGSVKQNKREP